jgi:biogenesis of lysosome-related organelles complex 1 subunit 2
MASEAEKQPNDDKDLDKVTEDMFAKLTAFLLGELQTTTEDYQLLEKMNAATAQKYSDMANTAQQLTTFMSELREKCM